MTENRDILDDKKLKEFPFKIPAGYFDSLEDRIRESAGNSGVSGKTVIMWIKPAVLLCAMFLIIAGLGLAASKLTGLLYHDPLASEDPIFALIEEGYLDSRFIYSHYDEIDLNEELSNMLEDTDGLENTVRTAVEQSIKEEELIEFIFKTEE